MNFFFFSTGSDYHSFHRKREIEAIAKLIEPDCGEVLYFNKPRYFLKRKAEQSDSRQKNIHIHDILIFCPISLAFKLRFLMYLFVTLPIQLQLAIYALIYGLKRKEITTWFYKPDQYLYLPKNYPYVYLHYDHYANDKHYFFSHLPIFNKTLCKCIAGSALSLFTSDLIMQELKLVDGSDNNFYYPNAIDRTLLNGNSAGKKTNKKPVIGFIGQIDDSFNVDLVDKLAESYPTFEFILVGPVKNSLANQKLASRANVKLVGYVDYQALKDQLNKFDLGICPYSDGGFNKYRNPLKVIEYFSYGIPVVCTECDVEINAMSLLSMSYSDDDFVNSIGIELSTNRESKVEQRKLYAENNCWDNRAEFIIEKIKQIYA